MYSSKQTRDHVYQKNENRLIKLAMWKCWQLKLFVRYWLEVWHFAFLHIYICHMYLAIIERSWVFSVLIFYSNMFSLFKHVFFIPFQIVQSGRGMVSTLCGHMFCKECLHEALDRTHACPKCQTKLTRKQYHPIYFWLLLEDDMHLSVNMFYPIPQHTHTFTHMHKTSKQYLVQRKESHCSWSSYCFL